MSTLKVNTIEEATSGGATFYTTKAWVNFDGFGVVSIRADGNVSSITDNGVGIYTVAFTSAVTDANFAAYGGAGQDANDPIRDTGFFAVNTTTSLKTETFYGNNTAADAGLVMIAVTR